MKLHKIQKLLACASLAAISACGGSNSTTSPVTFPSPGSVPVAARIVGIGDSLTAGYQSNGFLGQASPPIPNPNAGAPVPVVPPGQESGWWSLLWQQANGATWATEANPATSNLPLIAGAPIGLGDQLVTASPGSPLPFTSAKKAPCDSEDQAAFSPTAYTAARLQPMGNVMDLGIPSLTIHEAIAMIAPLSPTCQTIPGLPASLAGLNQVVNGESEMFYPVLGQFQNLGKNLTDLNAAVSLHPSLTTVWLGANDVLKYSFSAGTFCGGDSTHFVNGACTVDASGNQVQADITTIITTLQKAGSRVVVANLPNVLETPQFFNLATPPSQGACVVQTYALCVYEAALAPIFAAKGDPNALADAQAAAASIVAAAANPTTWGLGANQYLTESGAILALQQAVNPTTGAITPANINLDTNGKGSGLGALYLTPSFAAQVQTYNTAVNNGIAAAATATKTPLVDVKSIFDGIASGNPANPYFAAAIVNPTPNTTTGAPFTCCTLAFGMGLVSFDGLHPSNTGYALIANAFIQTINGAYGTTIPTVSAAGIYNGTSPNSWGAPDPYAPH